MIRLRKILLYKELYIILLILALIYLFIYLNFNFSSKYTKGESKITGEILEINFNNNQMTLLIKAKEKVLVNYYFKNSKDSSLAKKNLSLGDTLTFEGELIIPFENQNFYSFSYRTYLKYQHVFYIMKVNSYKKIKNNSHLLPKLKQAVRNHINDSKAGKYIKIFFLGDATSFDNSLKLDFQKLGISHLFALSGTQISFLMITLSWLLNLFKINDIKKMLLTFCILLIYYLIINSCAAIDRALVFSLIFSINKTFYFYIKPFHLIILSLSILLFINPYYIYDIGFQYSTVISCVLLIYMENNNNNRKVIELLKVSWVSFLASLPISLFNFSYINILSIIYNLFYVPFINIIIFPLAIICFFIKDLSFLLTFCINIFEKSIAIFSNINLGIIVLPRINIIFYFILFLLIICYLHFKDKKNIILIIIFLYLILHYTIPKLNPKDRLYMIDVGQGDSFLLISNNKSMLIDTGGVMSYYPSSNKTNKGHFTVQFLYKLGISKLDYLVLSHGDYDHAGEALNIIKEIKVKNIFFNSNKLNFLEKEIWNNTNGFKYKLSTGDTFSMGNFHFQVISGDFTLENDSSTILYTTIFDNTILFMGDASTKSEEYILNNYELNSITILKVGHHGSITSSSKEFLNAINPKYALISAGVDNKFNHPSSKIVKRLKNINTIIYDTRLNGMVLFDFKDNYIKCFKE